MNIERWTRRTLLRNAAVLAAAPLVRSHLLASMQIDNVAPTTVTTPLGTMRGDLAEGVRVFRGVPFAEPPVGDLRFRAPVATKPHTGELDATRFGAEPWQTGTPNVAKSEDCLQLNVWTPQDAKPGSLPVFVWIHGGGFTGGHAFEPIYDGSQFAREGIVCVTVAYRLGVFGFLDVGGVLQDETYRGSANNALRDLIMALQWVRQNIASMGGDPARVTIGGESAGAKLCDILMGTPSAQALFHSVISESGGAERIWSDVDARLTATGFARLWTATTGSPATSLKTADPKAIIAAQEQFIKSWPHHFPLRCEVDGVLLQTLPITTIAAGSTRGKRLLLGTNRDESALFLGPHPAQDPTAADLGNTTLAAFDAVYAKYAALYPDMTAEQRRIRAATAEEYWVPSMRVAAAHARNGGATYVYRLDFAETAGRFAGYAFHSEDVGLVWDKPGGSTEDRAAARVMATQMHAAWVAFIKGGEPTAQGLPTWPQWTATERKTMLLDRTSTVAVQPQEAELRLWDGVL